MAKVLIEVDVAYPHLFYKTLESQASVRQSVGEQGCLFRGVDENVHNRTFVVLDWSSAKTAKDFWHSDVARSHMEAWKSDEPPKVIVLLDSSSRE